MIERWFARALLAVLASAAALPAAAQVLYKLIDRQGRVTYADREPKDFDGTVVRIEADAGVNLVPGAKAGAEPSAAGAGYSERRRENRAALEGRLREAQARVEAARKAKDEGAEPLPEEWQVVQRHGPPLRSGEKPPSPNCFPSTGPGGGASLNCPGRVPNDAYYERQKKIDEELRLAEEALALAEREFRRGTD